MDSNLLASLAALLLSLVISYVPGVNTKYAGLSGEKKRAIMFLSLLLIAIGTVAVSCAGFAAELNISVTCDKVGIIGVFEAFIAALVVNQSAFLISPSTKAVKAVKAKKG